MGTTSEAEAGANAARQEPQFGYDSNGDALWWKKAGDYISEATTAVVAVSALSTKQGREFANKSYQAGVVQTDGYSDDEFLSMGDIMKGMAESTSAVEMGLKAVFALGNQMANQLEMESELRRAINEEAGLAGTLAEDLREEIWDAYPGILNMGYGIEEITKYYTQLIEQTGKFTLLNSDALERSAQIARAFVGNLSDMGEVLANFESVGEGATNALETINEVGVESLSLGLRSKTTIKDIGENIEMINQYGFQEGIKGLAAMSRKAVEFRMDMKNTFDLAEKVFNPEDAIKMSAEMQMIGGAIGEFNDPLKLMYMATNNVEGLQDALIGAADGLATYNSEQGRFEVSGANLRRAKDMADAMGVSMGDLTKTAIAASERSKTAMDLLSTGLQMDDEDREFLTNLGTMKDGVMTIQVPKSISDTLSLPAEIAVNQLTEDIKTTLIKNKEDFVKMDATDIAQGQLTELTKMERNVASIAAMSKVQASKMLKETELFKTGDAGMTKSNELLLESWTEGKLSSFIKGGLGTQTEQGQALLASISEVYSGSKNMAEKALKGLQETYKLDMKSKADKTAQNGSVNVNGHVTVGSANNQSAIAKETMREIDKVGLNRNKRSFVASDFFW